LLKLSFFAADIVFMGIDKNNMLIIKIFYMALIISIFPLSQSEAIDKTKNHCMLAIDKTIKCLRSKENARARKEMKKARKEIITNCLLDKYEFKRAEVCLELKKCKSFMRCITGHTIK
jgi:hypothetical protein